MKVHVNDELCDAHGQCVFAAPNVFAFDDIGELTFTAEADESERDAVEMAVRLCPVQAITVGS